jgi:hypothetical protein
MPDAASPKLLRSRGDFVLGEAAAVVESEHAEAVLGEIARKRRPRLAAAVALVGEHDPVLAVAVDDAVETRKVDSLVRLRRRR